MSKTVAVIDGNSLMHRAYHAVPPTMNAPDGTPTNAVFGFLSMFLKFYELYRPDAIICAFDAGKPEFRIKALEQYKAQRPPMDNELRVQFPLMEELLAAMAVPVVKVKGWEGDDILGTIAARDEALGYQTLLVTGDKDANQLVSPLTRVITTKKGITDVIDYDPDKVFEKYGVTPEQFPDFLGLMGDTSDNIPGVPGIGPKTATKLLQSYGSIEGIYEHLDELRGKQRENIEANRDGAFLSREIATIVRDLDFPCDIENAAFPSFDEQEVTEAFGKLQLSMHLSKVLGLIGSSLEPQHADVATGPLLEGAEGAALVEAAIAAGERVGVYAAMLDEPSLFSLGGATVAFSAAQGTAVLESEDAAPLLAKIVREGKLAALDVKALLQGKCDGAVDAPLAVYPADTASAARVEDADLLSMDVFDAALAAYVADSNLSQATMKQLAARYLGGELEEGDDAKRNVALCAAALRALEKPLADALDDEGSRSVYEQIDVPLIAVLLIMERTGAMVDVARLEELGASTASELAALRARIYELAGEEFNVDSPKQLGHILFEVMGYTPKKKTTRGYSTDASVLKELAQDFEMPALVLRYRELAKIKGTYIDALPRMRAADGRIHTTFHQTVTTTGRLSSSDPNLQNIPVRTEFGRQIRGCFTPLRDGHVFLSGDYSQIELRLLAHLSGDEGLIAAFNEGEDFHAQTAARVFGLPVDQVTPELRSRAKAVNFGIVYGQQAFGLSQSLRIPFGEAKDLIDSYFLAYPGVRAYLDKIVADAKEAGYAVTMYGRRRHIPELHVKNATQRGFGERTAMNHPMQGAAADIIKKAMRQVIEAVEKEGFDAQLMLQVHDELDFSVREDEAAELAERVRGIMEGVAELRVPLEVDVRWAPTWAQAH